MIRFVEACAAFVLGVLLALILLALFSEAHSAELKYEPHEIVPYKNVVILNGHVNHQSVYEVLKVIDTGKYRYLRLNSSGGYVWPAFRLANELLKRKNIDTVIGPEDHCVSACATIFIAGKRRIWYRGGRLGVHRDNLWHEKRNRFAKAERRRIVTAAGVDPGYYYRLEDTPHNEMYFFSEEELRKYSIATVIAVHPR